MKTLKRRKSKKELKTSDIVESLKIAPYELEIVLEGVVPILFNRWDCAAVEDKAGSKKGCFKRKEDDPDRAVYLCDDKTLGITSDMLHASLIEAGKYKTDPRNSRKSAFGLVRSSILVSPAIASLHKDTWDFIDARRVRVQQSYITRRRPALKEGWRVTFTLTVLEPEYMGEDFVTDLISIAGRFCGLGDYHPKFGRFKVISIQSLFDEN